MDLSSFLKDRSEVRRTGDLLTWLRDGTSDLREQIRRRTEILRRRERALSAIDSLIRCDSAFGFGSDTYEHWLFVSRYAIDADTFEPTELECVIVPDAVGNGLRHRPKPHDDPTEAASGTVTMTPTSLTGRDIGEAVVSRYAKDVRLGTYDDVLSEPCATCAKPAVIACQHYVDTGNEHQWITLHRLCVNCPRLEELAAIGCGYYETPPFLPPAKPPARRY